MKMRRNQLLIFSRWCQVMLRFEKGMYDNPDQDLNKSLVGPGREVPIAEATRTDRNAPGLRQQDPHRRRRRAYYHNYMMGQLFACQVHQAICPRRAEGEDPKTISYVGRKDVGEFMKQRVFAPGRTMSWDELTKFATGERLNPRAFAADFGGEKAAR